MSDIPVPKWFPDRGFGIIEPDDAARTGGSAFVHFLDLLGAGIAGIEEGDAFCYEVVKKPGGRTAAVNLELMEKVHW